MKILVGAKVLVVAGVGVIMSPVAGIAVGGALAAVSLANNAYDESNKQKKSGVDEKSSLFKDCVEEACDLIVSNSCSPDIIPGGSGDRANAALGEIQSELATRVGSEFRKNSDKSALHQGKERTSFREREKNKLKAPSRSSFR